MSEMRFIDLKTQYQKLQNGINQSIQRVLNHGQFIMGPEVAELEARLAAFVGVKHCVGVSNGTDALLIAMMALGIEPGDEIITTPFTFYSTIGMMVHLGAVPVFVDIDPDSYNIDANKIEAAITKKTKAIMAVSLYGQCADMTGIQRIADQYHLPVIEDGAQSFGATHHGKYSCSLSAIGITSFFPSKPLGCYGDAGACFTNDDRLAELMRQMRVHGQQQRYVHTERGINGRLDTLQAAILLEKFKIFPQEIQLRQKVAAMYCQRLESKLKPPIIEAGNTSVFAQYTIRVAYRDEFREQLQKKGIPTAVHYPRMITEQPIIQRLGFGSGKEYPNAAEAAKTVVSLPMHPYLKEQEIEFIANTVNDVVKEACVE